MVPNKVYSLCKLDLDSKLAVLNNFVLDLDVQICYVSQWLLVKV